MNASRDGISASLVLVVLAMVTLVATQDFYRADLDSLAALRAWWVDAPFHIVNIDLLTGVIAGQPSSGSSAASGGASGFYHFLSYVPTALACAAFGIAPIKGYALIYAPLSIFLFVLGLWLLAATLWSKEQALWATVVLMLLPDSLPYLGSSNEFLRLKWLVSVSPGLGYGVFFSAVAWVLTVKGVRAARLGYVALGWLACGITVLIKAHLFFANALPLAIYTIARYPNLRTPLRGALLLMLLLAYAAATWVAGAYLAIPLIRLDFSNAAAYAAILATPRPLDGISLALLRTVVGLPGWAAPWLFAPSLLFLHFGLLLLPMLFLLRRDLRRGLGGVWLPPLAVFGIYVLHAAGLARDTRPYTYSGESIELIHRPFVWGVSLMVVWTLASLAANYPKVLTVTRRWSVCLLLLPVGIYGYHGLQFAPTWPAPRIDYSDTYFEALQLVSRQAAPGELVQSADLDPLLAVQAATGRAPFVANYAMRPHPASEVVDRSREVSHWLQETDPTRIAAFAARNDISWLVAREGSVLAWPPQFIAQHARFEKNGVLVVRFKP